MRSKIIFIISLFLVVCWIYLFTFFSEIIYIHIVAVLAIVGFVVSYITKSKNQEKIE